jgi:hypothetical protein
MHHAWLIPYTYSTDTVLGLSEIHLIKSSLIIECFIPKVCGERLFQTGLLLVDGTLLIDFSEL